MLIHTVMTAMTRRVATQKADDYWLDRVVVVKEVVALTYAVHFSRITSGSLRVKASLHCAG